VQGGTAFLAGNLVEEGAKLIPLLGSVIAGGISCGTTIVMGKVMINEHAEILGKILSFFAAAKEKAAKKND